MSRGNISCAYSMKGNIPFTKTGKHRRVRMEDLLHFKAKRDEDRKSKLNELTSLSAEYGGYDELK